jgi:enoyl-CoA hydratase/carnithine racemase
MVKHIVLESQVNDLAIIKINRPEVLNALDKEVATELYTALDIANADDKIRVIIITGSGERGLTGIQRPETAKKHNECWSHFLGVIRFCGI